MDPNELDLEPGGGVLAEVRVPNEIAAFFHCPQCFEEYEKDPNGKGVVSRSDYQRISVGWTKEGLQVWCDRHECNMLHINFDGAQHRAITASRVVVEEGKGIWD